MRAGSLRHSITIERRSQVRDPLDGGLSDKWVPLAADVAASIEPLRGKELFTAQQVRPDVLVRIRVRFRPGIDDTMRVRHGNTIYSILYLINVDVRNIDLHLMCSQGLNEG